MSCKGICESYRVLRNNINSRYVNGARYADGQKRCQICEIFIRWDGIFCPCCNNRLRIKQRNKSFKAKLRAMK